MNRHKRMNRQTVNDKTGDAFWNRLGGHRSRPRQFKKHFTVWFNRFVLFPAAASIAATNPITVRLCSSQRGAAAPTRLSDARAQEDRFDHARRIGDSLAGDVERGAVIGRRARERKAERDVHRAAERRDLDRRHADVVIRRDDRVELAAHRAHEHRVGRKWSGDAGLDARPDVAPSSSSSPKRPPSPACGFSAQSAIVGSAMPNQSVRPRRVMLAADTIASLVTADGHVAQREMRGREHDAQRIRRAG